MPQLFNGNINCLKFGKIVDYGTRDKDLVYVPILREESDTFEKMEPNISVDSEFKQPTKSKLKKFVQGAGTIYATAEIAPELVGGICDKGSNVINSLEEFATKSINSVANIKETYNKTFRTSKESVNEHKDDSELTNQYDATDDVTPFSQENASSNLYNENKLNYENTQDIDTDITEQDGEDFQEENKEDDDYDNDGYQEIYD